MPIQYGQLAAHNDLMYIIITIMTYNQCGCSINYLFWSLTFPITIIAKEATQLLWTCWRRVKNVSSLLTCSGPRVRVQPRQVWRP